jgi:branched-subunit amino acid aminotransferase/4-amino-4-deoxychorismate lyase
MRAVKSLPILTAPELARRLAAARQPYHDGYYAFYSSLLDGLVTDPTLMTVPLDDHLVHRGDGVFETLKCVEGGIYLWREHVDRLLRSAHRIGLQVPWTREVLADLTAQTVRAGGHRDCLVRMIVSRGPGSLGVSPYDCPRPGLYILAHELKPSFMAAHPGGARVITSALPVKPSFFATIKSCNYLPNALLKKEAADAGVDFALCFDEAGRLAEGATENAGLVTRDHVLRVPTAERILAGTTMNRALELARALLGPELRAVETGPITRVDLAAAAEILIFGTTPDVTAVIELDGRAIGPGEPGPVWRLLHDQLVRDLHGNADLRLSVFNPANAP